MCLFGKIYNNVMTSLNYPPSEDDLRVYAILNLQEPPRLLINRSGGKQLHCHFGLPLPQQIIIFRLGKPTSYGYRSRISIEVYLDDEKLPFLVGYLERNDRSVCYQPKWTKDFLSWSHVLHEKDSMAKLVLTIQECKENDHSSHETRQLVVKLSREFVVPFPIRITCNPVCEQPSKKLKKLSSIEAMKKMNKGQPLFVDYNNNQFQKETPSTQPDKCITELTPAPSPTLSAMYTPSECSHNPKISNLPSGRWGHTASSINEYQVIVVGGQGENYHLVKDSLCVFDCGTKTWQPNIPQNIVDRRMGHSTTFDPKKNVLYMYGGCKYKRWFSDVNVLNLVTWEWRTIKAVGSAPKRAYHTSTLFQGELLVFGGVHPNPHPEPDSCSSDLHMFNPETSSWYKPIVSGHRPPPCSGHSLVLYDQHKAIIFGGWDVLHCYNDVYLIDLVVMEYSKPNVVGIKPACRTWHSSTLLTGRRLLVHGGFDGVANQVLDDAFIYDIDKQTWLAVSTSPKIPQCAGHVMFCPSYNDEEDQVMVFGGGDNHGKFFSNLLTVNILSMH